MTDTIKPTPDALPKAAGNTTFFIFVTMMLSSIGFGLIIPIMPALLEELTGLDTAEATRWGTYLTVTYAVMNFMFTPLLSSLSDRFGRRPVLLLSLGVMSLDYLVLGFATSLWVLFAARLLAGITGATFATANAYVADTTDPDKRAAAFGLVGAAFGLGFIIGPIIGGVMGHYMGPRAPFFAASLVALINVLYGYFVLPESLKPENRRKFEWSRANPVGTFRSIMRVKSLRWLLVVVFFYSAAHFIYPAIWSYYAKSRYVWTELEVGLSLGVFGVAGALAQVFLIKIIIKRYGPAKTATIGLMMEAVTFFGLAITGYGYLAYIWIASSALGAVTMPALNQIMSSRTRPDEQGEMQGAISCINSVATIVSTLGMGELFARFGGKDAAFYMPGIPFFVACGLVIIAAIILNLALNRSGFDGIPSNSKEAAEGNPAHEP